MYENLNIFDINSIVGSDLRYDFIIPLVDGEPVVSTEGNLEAYKVLGYSISLGTLFHIRCSESYYYSHLKPALDTAQEIYPFLKEISFYNEVGRAVNYVYQLNDILVFPVIDAIQSSITPYYKDRIWWMLTEYK
jgi:hypothetical protein